MVPDATAVSAQGARINGSSIRCAATTLRNLDGCAVESIRIA